MSAKRSKFLPSAGEELRLSDVLAPVACVISFALGFLVRCLLVLAIVALPLSAAESATTNKKHSKQECRVVDPSRTLGPLKPTPAPGPVAERPPSVDRHWPERRMCVAPDLRDPHKWVREQEKNAWRFVDSIGK